MAKKGQFFDDLALTEAERNFSHPDSIEFSLL